MAIARSRGGLIGTNETTGLVTIANNATSTGSEGTSVRRTIACSNPGLSLL